MIEAFVGLLKNEESVTSEEVKVRLHKSNDVQEYLQDHDHLMGNMTVIDPVSLSDSVLTKHLDDIKKVTKSYIDPTDEDYKKCSPYACFIAWASQFVMLCRHSQQEDKVEKQITSLEKEMEQKINKRATLDKVLQSFNKDGYIAYFADEISQESSRLQKYDELLHELTEETLEHQKTYTAYEKQFFSNLEQKVIKKKQASQVKKGVY